MDLKEAEEALKKAREELLAAHQSGDKDAVEAAKNKCAALRPKAPMAPLPPAEKDPPLGVKKPMRYCCPGISGPGALPEEQICTVYRLVGSSETKSCAGLVTLITGASRGIGKGISQMLAEAGAVVYVTGRSSPGKVTDILLMGTVDETAASFGKVGGVGIATHVDHAQATQNKALADLVANNHGRLDLLINNAFYIPKPDLIFFSTPIWAQPIRFMHEQMSVGGFNHIAQTMLFLPCLRRGKGGVLNISSWGSQMNIGIFPVSYLVNKAAFDKGISTLSEKLRPYDVHVMTLWPGNVKSERSIMGAKRSGAKLIDLESVRFSGAAVVKVAKLSQEELARFSLAYRTFSCMDIQRHEIDGYMHEKDLHTYTTGGRLA
jgi:NAD(P)-dependent dehydrogenase (short-subunit alcohol dehydrogenase family)